MKKAFLMALACLLLAGCGAPSETVTPTDSWPDSALAETNEAAAESPPEPISTAPAESPPATAPAEPLSAPAVVTAGQAPEEPYDLPTEVIGLKDWIGESRWNHDPVGLLAELPERELSLYGVTKWLDSSALLRWGDSLAEFSWSFGGPLIVEPQLWCWDVDSDGQEEVVVINHVGSGTGTSIEELHVLKKDGDGTLTDYRLPEDDLCGGQLTAALRVETVEGRTFAVLGRELLEITELTEGRTPPQGLAAGSFVGFGVDPADPYGVPIRFRGSAWLEGEDYPPTAWYAADLSARVQYENGMFTLSGLHLDGIE